MDDPDLTRIAKALADPRRAAILKKIADERVSMCGDVLTCADISPSTMSHHLRELEAAGLITLEREGKFLRLIYRPDTMQTYLAHLSRSFHLAP